MELNDKLNEDKDFITEEENITNEDFSSTTTGFIGGLKYSKLLNGSKNRWKTLISEVKKYDPSNPIISAIFNTIILGLYIPRYYYHKIKGKEEQYTYKIVNNWGKTLIKIAKMNLEQIGKVNIEKDRSYVFISNHTSPYDIPVIYGTLPVLAGFVANIELSKMPVMNFWMKKAHSIFVDIYNQKSKVSTLKRILENLKNKQHVIIFPEGKMSKDGNLQEFNRGGLKAAQIGQSVIIPIALIGVRDVIPPGGFTLKVDQKVRICFGEPIDVLNLSSQENKDIDKIAFDTINSLIKKYSF
ncbi:MAG: 1-acyl-sn-glycerol-3-phosphate acyltransferase [Spirochaetales bacterium]|nr:1-acyl-sn-glycerol-3-phosphate acyltransferase [Exilispira sp.]NMC66825.1 1-acyl-sn-glycerol-3-phosphate acyltransferase [Spirochaetales bacterium]